MGLLELLLVLAALGSVVGFVLWRVQHQLTLFVVRVEEGRIATVKGRMPRRLLGDLADAIRQERRRDLRILCRIEDGTARLRVYGDTNPGFEQVLRNLVGEYPLQRLRQSPQARL